jgi:hypothetical protein
MWIVLEFLIEQRNMGGAYLESEGTSILVEWTFDPDLMRSGVARGTALVVLAVSGLLGGRLSL